MSLLIKNGRVITATRRLRRRRLLRRRHHRRHRQGPALASLPGRADDRRDRAVRHPGRDRRPHAPEHAVRRHDVGRRLRVGHDRGRVRRHDEHRRLRHPVPRPDDEACARRLAEAGRRQGGDRLRLPHDRHRARRRRARRDGPHGPRRGDHQLQAVHGLPGRVHGGRRDDLPGVAANRGERRAASACTPKTAA